MADACASRCHFFALGCRRYAAQDGRVKLAFLVLAVGAVVAAVLLRRSRRPQPIAAAAFEPDPPYGLTLEGPTTATLPAEGDESGPQYPATLIAHVSLPSALWPAARQRLMLVVTGPAGWRRENTFSALDQPLGMNISPHFEPPVEVPHVTPELLAKHEGSGNDVASTFRANVALLGFPPGRATYHARAVLDDLQSNELHVDVTVEAALRR
jgi:hypothetical protein